MPIFRTNLVEMQVIVQKSGLNNSFRKFRQKRGVKKSNPFWSPVKIKSIGLKKLLLYQQSRNNLASQALTQSFNQKTMSSLKSLTQIWPKHKKLSITSWTEDNQRKIERSTIRCNLKDLTFLAKKLNRKPIKRAY